MRLALTNPAFHFHEADIAAPGFSTRLRRDYPEPNYIFHLAAVASMAYSMVHKQETLHLNYVVTRAICEEARDLGCSAFVFAGSAAEYGDTETFPLQENAPDMHTRHLSPYGRTKFLSSRYIENAGFGCSLRFFNIYGPRQDPSSPYSGVISRFMHFGTKHEPLTVFGDGSQIRDFIYVQDAVRAYLLAAGLEGACDPLRGIFNVCTGKHADILSLAENINTLTDNHHPVLFGPVRPGDIPKSIGDGNKFRRATGFSPSHTLMQGLANTLKWYKGQP
ncbi:MAG: NAD-dependent epimerase/dehydratase family protein, partial [Proteobacteria bacterium]|nr:NAD-dependent epimerase/dehydratase family protein [Pseudomonadota bacterium]